MLVIVLPHVCIHLLCYLYLLDFPNRGNRANCILPSFPTVFQIRLLVEYSPFRSNARNNRSSPVKNLREHSLADSSSPSRLQLYNETDTILNDLKLFISTFTRRLILRIGERTECNLTFLMSSLFKNLAEFYFQSVNSKLCTFSICQLLVGHGVFNLINSLVSTHMLLARELSIFFLFIFNCVCSFGLQIAFRSHIGYTGSGDRENRRLVLTVTLFS